MGATDRGVSPVVGVAMMIVIVVALVAVVGGGFLGMGGMLEDPGPYSGVETDAEITSSGSASCSGDDVVTITHLSGDPVPTENLELIIRIRGGEHEATITNLPTGGSTIDDGNLEGDTDVIDESSGCVGGALLEEEWVTGSALEFRVNHGESTTDLQPGDEIEIVAVDTESETIVMSESLEATDG